MTAIYQSTVPGKYIICKAINLKFIVITNRDQIIKLAMASK